MSEKSDSNIKPLADLVLAGVDEAPTTTASGLYLPENTEEKPKTATVVAVGPKVKDIKKGDQIIYESYSGTEVKLNNKEYILVKEEKILALLA